MEAVALAAPDEEEPIRLTYHASSGCPDEADFVARIRARTTRARVAWPGEAARTFDVSVDAGPPPWGSVTVLTNRAAATRRVQADTCEDVTDALALVIALTVDPHTSAAPVAAPALAVPSSHAPELRPPLSAAPTTDDASFENRPSTRARWNAFAGADFAVTYGVAPSPLLGGLPYAGWRANTAGAFDPSVRLALVRATSEAHAPPTGSAAFVWTAARFDACPTEWAGDFLRLTLCARLEAGALTVAAGDVGVPETRVRPGSRRGWWLGRNAPSCGPCSSMRKSARFFALRTTAFTSCPTRPSIRSP